MKAKDLIPNKHYSITVPAKSFGDVSIGEVKGNFLCLDSTSKEVKDRMTPYQIEVALNDDRTVFEDNFRSIVVLKIKDEYNVEEVM